MSKDKFARKEIDSDEGALDTEIDLTLGWCVWQDQVIFFNMAQAAMDVDFDTDKGFSFCLTPDDNERECDEWNTQCTAKLKEVVTSARQRQSTKEGEIF